MPTSASASWARATALRRRLRSIWRPGQISQDRTGGTIVTRAALGKMAERIRHRPHLIDLASIAKCFSAADFTSLLCRLRSRQIASS
jgi:hypothetical protein